MVEQVNDTVTVRHLCFCSDAHNDGARFHAGFQGLLWNVTVEYLVFFVKHRSFLSIIFSPCRLQQRICLTFAICFLPCHRSPCKISCTNTLFSSTCAIPLFSAIFTLHWCHHMLHFSHPCLKPYMKSCAIIMCIRLENCRTQRFLVIDLF